jgi:hypothetical protein
MIYCQYILAEISNYWDSAEKSITEMESLTRCHTRKLHTTFAISLITIKNKK